MSGRWVVVVVTGEQSNFKASQLGGERGGGVYAGGMGEMQEDDGCEEPRAIVMSCCKSIIQGDAFW